MSELNASAPPTVVKVSTEIAAVIVPIDAPLIAILTIIVAFFSEKEENEIP